MMTVTDIQAHAVHLRDELDALAWEMEHSSTGPRFRSAMARDLMESRTRVNAVIEACAAPLIA